MADTVRVGRFIIDLEDASQWVRTYTDAEANAESANPYAYPAYDRYESGSNNPGTLTDGDLLAPVLLNVDISIRSYYGLKESRLNLSPCWPTLSSPQISQD